MTIYCLVYGTAHSTHPTTEDGVFEIAAFRTKEEAEENMKYWLEWKADSEYVRIMEVELK